MESGGQTPVALMLGGLGRIQTELTNGSGQVVGEKTDMLRYLTALKKALRKERNYKANDAIYARGASTLPAEYLTRHQEADAATKNKILAAAHERRNQRNVRRLAQSRKTR